MGCCLYDAGFDFHGLDAQIDLDDWLWQQTESGILGPCQGDHLAGLRIHSTQLHALVHAQTHPFLTKGVASMIMLLTMSRDSSNPTDCVCCCCRAPQVQRLLDVDAATCGEVQVPHLGEAFLTTVHHINGSRAREADS